MVLNLSGSMGWQWQGEQEGWFHAHNLDPMYTQMKVCVLARCLHGLVPNRPQISTDLWPRVGDPFFKLICVYISCVGPKIWFLKEENSNYIKIFPT